MPPELRNSTRINFLVVGPHNEKCRIWTVHTTGAVVYPPRREGLIIEALIFEIQEKVRTSLLIRFDHTDIDLYHPRESLRVADVKPENRTQYEDMILTSTLCQGPAPISLYYPDEKKLVGRVHFLVKLGRVIPTIEPEDEAHPLPERPAEKPSEQWYWDRLDKIRLTVPKWGPPSLAAKASVYSKYQKGPARIFDGRWSNAGMDNKAPPIELYNPVFALLRREISDKNTPTTYDDIRLTMDLMSSLSRVESVEGVRSDSSNDLVAKLIGKDLVSLVNTNRTSPDHCVSVSLSSVTSQGTVAPLIFEEKAEMGKTGTDPAVQVELSYLHYWMDSSRRNILEASCCPSILLAMAGPHMCIMGAVLLDKVVVQHFTGWMHIAEDSAGGEDDANDLGDLCVERLAQVFVSLRHAVEALTEWYQMKVVPGRSFSRFFPWIDHFENEGEVTNFVYLKALQAHAACKTFLVQKTGGGHEGELLVVKFVETYGNEVQDFMASHGLAPKLHHCAALADMFPGHSFRRLMMVAMDPVSGETLEDKYGGSVVPKDVADKIAAVLTTLWDAGWVHGDIRAPNLMIDDGGSVKLIDYDWAGADAKVEYPLRISLGLFLGVDGVVGGRKIRKKHDEGMVRKFISLSAPDL